MRILPLLVTFTVFFFNALHVRAELLIRSGDTVAFMGDSITQFGATQSGGYVLLTTAGLSDQGVNVTMINAGWSGNSSRDMLGRLQRDVIDKRATWMTLSAGVNDVMHDSVQLDEYKTNITAILDRCQAAGVKVIVLTATQIGLPVTNAGNVELAGYNSFLRETAQNRNLPLCDMNAAMVEEQAVYAQANAERALTYDGVHMNIYGNMVMAKRLLATIGLSSNQTSALQTKWNHRSDVYPLPNGQTPRGTGTGYKGQYFSDVNFTNLVRTQTDVQLYNFQWGSGSPTYPNRTRMTDMPSDNFSVRWTGQLQALEEGIYSFFIAANDTAKVWIGDVTGTPLLNKMAAGTTGSVTKGTMHLAAGQRYNIRVDYTELTGDADIHIQWTRPGLQGGNIPSTQIYSTTGPAHGIETWRQHYFGAFANSGNAADSADTDKDGHPNLLEYALGGNPIFADSLAIAPVSGTANVSGSSYLTLTYPLPADRTGITFLPQATGSLTSGVWEAAVLMGSSLQRQGFNSTAADFEAAFNETAGWGTLWDANLGRGPSGGLATDFTDRAAILPTAFTTFTEAGQKAELSIAFRARVTAGTNNTAGGESLALGINLAATPPLVAGDYLVVGVSEATSNSLTSALSISSRNSGLGAVSSTSTTALTLTDNAWYRVNATLTYDGGTKFTIVARLFSLGAAGTSMPTLIDTYTITREGLGNFVGAPVRAGFQGNSNVAVGGVRAFDDFTVSRGTVTYRDSLPVGSAVSRFLRLKLTTP
jgi:lysophospholipase L1-like esterase